MSHSYLVSFAFLVFVVVIDADSSLTGPKSTLASELQPNSSKGDMFQTTNEIDIPVARLLRTNKASDEGHTEERAGGISVSSFETLKSAIMSSKGTPQKLEKWLQKGKSADAAFKRFRLDKPGTFLFDRPHFAVWIDYADKLSAKFPEMSAISTLTKHYGDRYLYEIIQIAKRRSDMEKLAIKLETEQIQHWIATRKNPDEFFRLLWLNWDGIKVFDDPKFIIWAKYVDDLNIKHPEEPTWMYSTLTKYLKEDVLFQMTNGAKGSTKTKTIATKVEDDWIDAVLEKHKTPVQLLQNLGLGKTTDNLLDRVVFDDALVRTWSRYMELFNKRYPDEKTTMLVTFTIVFGDDSVTKMLDAAKSESWTRPLAAKMETEQLKMWLDSGKSVDEVFNLLRLHEAVMIESFQDKLLFNTWVSYINAFVKANPDKKDAIFSALQSRFTDRSFNKILNEAKQYPSMESTATKLQTDKIATYLTNNKSPGDVFDLLSLKDQGVDILASPLFYAWMKYVDAFKKRNPNHHQSWFYAIRSELEYGGVQTIEKGMQNPRTIEIAKRLEREWQNFWLDQEKLPNVVFRYLSLNTAGEDVLADPKFKRWATYLSAFSERYPDKYTTMIDGFLDNIGNRHLVQMLNAAKKDPESEKLATNLEDGLIDKWMADGLNPEELKRKFAGYKPADEMIDWYIMKLAARKTS